MASSITRAVLDFAKHVLGHDITPRNNTTKAALDAFLDEVAGHDVDTRGMGVPEIIDVITENYTPGGSGVDVGALVQVTDYGDTSIKPVIGGSATSLTPIYDVAIIKIGDATIADNTTSGNGMPSDAGWASGVTLTTIWMPAYSDPASDAAYAFTYTTETVEDVEVFKTVTMLENAMTMETMNDGDLMKRYTFTVPEVDEGTYFAVAYEGNWD